MKEKDVTTLVMSICKNTGQDYGLQWKLFLYVNADHKLFQLD